MTYPIPTNPPWAMGSSIHTVFGMNTSLDTVFGMGNPPLGGFTPSNLTGLVRWYDATQITGLASGSSVPTWNDLSTTASHATNPTASTQPLYFTNAQNGKSVVSFGGTHLLQTTTSAIAQPCTWFFTTKVGAAGATIYAMADQGAAFVAMAENSGQLFYGAPTLSAYTTVSFNGVFVAMAAIVNGSTSTGYTNGSTQSLAKNPGANSVTSFSIGGVNGAGSWIGTLGEIIAYNRALATAELNQVFNYLGPKWGVTIV